MKKARLYLKKIAAAPFELLARCFPGNLLFRSAADRWSFVRSVYGPFIYNTPWDRTFELSLTGYGPFVAEAVSALDSEFVFLDIGANLGLFSLLAARHRHCRGVYAFEPIPRTFRILQANLRRNRAAIVEAKAMAIVGPDDTHAFLSYTSRHSGLSQVIVARPVALQAQTISAIALDRLVSTEGRIVAKIDVEGAELSVLETLRVTGLYHRIDEIIIEISETNLGAEKKAQLLHLLREDGFREIKRSGAPEHYDAHYIRSVR